MFSCANDNGHKAIQQMPAEVVDTVSDMFKPLFDDVNGEIDSLYKANGYVYSLELENAVLKGDLDAADMLASMYAYGIGGVQANRKKAYQLYRMLAEEGNAMAQATVGYMMVYGVGPVEDFEAGMEWLEKSANQRCPMAFYYLGNYFEQTGDVKNARTCYGNAVALGYVPAEADLKALDNK